MSLDENDEVMNDVQDLRSMENQHDAAARVSNTEPLVWKMTEIISVTHGRIDRLLSFAAHLKERIRSNIEGASSSLSEEERLKIQEKNYKQDIRLYQPVMLFELDEWMKELVKKLANSHVETAEIFESLRDRIFHDNNLYAGCSSDENECVEEVHKAVHTCLYFIAVQRQNFINILEKKNNHKARIILDWLEEFSIYLFECLTGLKQVRYTPEEAENILKTINASLNHPFVSLRGDSIEELWQTYEVKKMIQM